MDNIKSEQFYFEKTGELKHFSTKFESHLDEEMLERELEKVRIELSKLQDRMYAHNKYGVLLCFQGMDAAGKDSLIREVFKDFNARGVVVHSFKSPNTKELQHDFLWRHYLALPEKGKFSVFNRSHYENVLITRVNPQFLSNERHPQISNTEEIDDTFWENRFESIRDFEKHCARNGIIVMKFYLHMSKEEQRKRLLRRIDKGKHNWKFDPSDVRDRALWDAYSSCYEEAFQQTSKKHAPWYVIPADNKVLSRLIVAQIILEQLSTYNDIVYPKLAPEIQASLEEYKKILEAEKPEH
jgi:PPK2 family polyphosphate:nucleotide phosphotransferase